MIFSDLSGVNSVDEKLSRLEGRDIDGLSLQFPEHLAFLSEFSFARVRGRPQILHENGMQNKTADISESLLIGLYASQCSFCYIIDNFPGHVEIYVGSKRRGSTQGTSIHRSILEGHWGQRFIYEDHSAQSLVRSLGTYTTCGTITGIPDMALARKQAKDGQPSDLWMRSLQGKRWTYLVCGFDLQRKALSEYESNLIREVTHLRTRFIREDILYGERRLAEHCQELLETYLRRLGQGRLSGAWQVGAYFFAHDEPLIMEGLGIISSRLGGKKSALQPIRAHLCHKNPDLQPSFRNLLTSHEAAPLVSFPDEEAPGYTIQQVAQFNNDSIGSTGRRPLGIGFVFRNWIPTANIFHIDADDLTKHGLIAGVTGSGKTTTCFHILRQLLHHNIPFLVIESAKSEYRQLLNDPAFKDMLIFTLGDETPDGSAPFRLNPFEVPPGILIQTHLDYLKSLFRASFVLYAPMPYVLEEALHEVYRDKGWNLSTNRNTRGNGSTAFPTLTDLYEKIDDVVRRLGYSEDISKDVLAGLKTRINNLRLGGKGLMLDTYQSVSIGELVNKPVLLELNKLGNDDEKAFVIGLILTRIYEQYEAGGGAQGSKGLRHLTLIEEAHRLLKHVPEAADSDGNVRGKAVETFCNMLSEIRAFGEGILVSEQIPQKLARDIIKNSNLKVMHRLVAKDDRDIAGDTMNLSQEQKTYATTLGPGQAIVYAERMDGPFLVAVPTDEKQNTSLARHVSNADINNYMKERFYNSRPSILLKYKECSRCALDKDRCEPVRESIKAVLSGQKQEELFNRVFMTAALHGPGRDIVSDVDRAIREHVQVRESRDIPSIHFCFLIQATHLAMTQQGYLYGYSYSDTDLLASQFLDLMSSFVVCSTTDGERVSAFRRLFVDIRKKPEKPFTGCTFCSTVCRYRFETSLFLKDRALNEDFDFITTKISDDDKMWAELGMLCINVAKRTASISDPVTLGEIALCYLAQKVAARGFAPRIQEKVVKNVRMVVKRAISVV